MKQNAGIIDRKNLILVGAAVTALTFVVFRMVSWE